MAVAVVVIAKRTLVWLSRKDWQLASSGTRFTAGCEGEVKTMKKKTTIQLASLPSRQSGCLRPAYREKSLAAIITWRAAHGDVPRGATPNVESEVGSKKNGGRRNEGAAKASPGEERGEEVRYP